MPTSQVMITAVIITGHVAAPGDLRTLKKGELQWAEPLHHVWKAGYIWHCNDCSWISGLALVSAVQEGSWLNAKSFIKWKWKTRKLNGEKINQQAFMSAQMNEMSGNQVAGKQSSYLYWGEQCSRVHLANWGLIVLEGESRLVHITTNESFILWKPACAGFSVTDHWEF